MLISQIPQNKSYQIMSNSREAPSDMPYTFSGVISKKQNYRVIFCYLHVTVPADNNTQFTSVGSTRNVHSHNICENIDHSPI